MVLLLIKVVTERLSFFLNKESDSKQLDSPGADPTDPLRAGGHEAHPSPPVLSIGAWGREGGDLQHQIPPGDPQGRGSLDGRVGGGAPFNSADHTASPQDKPPIMFAFAGA